MFTANVYVYDDFYLQYFLTARQENLRVIMYSIKVMILFEQIAFIKLTHLEFLYFVVVVSVWPVDYLELEINIKHASANNYKLSAK